MKISKRVLSMLILIGMALAARAQHAMAKKWDYRYGGTANDYISMTCRTTDNGYIMAGTTYSGMSGDITQPTRGSTDIWLIQVDSLGRYRWDRRYGGTSLDGLSCMISLQDEGYLLLGTSFSNIGGEKSDNARGEGDYWLIRIDTGGNKLWDRTYGGGADEDGWKVIRTSDRGFMMCGSSNSGIGGDKTENNRGTGHSTDCWIVKTDSLGNKQWDRRYGTSRWESGNNIFQTPDNGYIILAISDGDSIDDLSAHSFSHNTNAWIIKIDSTGHKLWDKLYGGFEGDVLYSISPGRDGHYILGGQAYDEISGNKTSQKCGYWLIEIDSAGDKTGDWAYGSGVDCATSSHLDYWYDMSPTDDSGFLLYGGSRSPAAGDKTETNLGASQGWMIRIDSNMHKIWDKTIFSYGRSDGIASVFENPGGCLTTILATDAGIGGDKSQPSWDSTFDYWIVSYCDTVITAIPEVVGDIHFSIYPNPTTREVSIHLDQQATREASFTLTSATGQRIYHSDDTNLADSYTKTLDLGTLPSGMYLIDIAIAGHHISRRVVKE